MDPAELRRYLVEIRVGIDDADSIVRDMLRPPRRRHFGPVLHRRQYREAYEKMTHTLGYLLGEKGGDPPEGEPTKH